MKKIGILTFHAGLNHGGFLQVYCLKKLIDSYGYNTNVINYVNPVQKKLEWQYFIKSYPLTRPWGIKIIIGNLLKYIKFHLSFRKLNLTKKVTDNNFKDISSEFKVIITGSDEIWNINNFAFPNHCWFFYGENLNPKVLIGFSPSFANSNLVDLKDTKATVLLSRYKCISVRDKHSQNIAEELLGTSIKITLDPTLLFDPYTDFKIRKPHKEPYILVYINSITNAEKTLLLQFAKSKGLKIISISYQHFWADKNHISVGVGQWLSYFKFADYVVTNTFHGLIFALKNFKPTWIVNRTEKQNKINGLLDQLDISICNCVANSISELENEFEISKSEFEKAFKKIGLLQSESKKYLNDAIKN